MKILWSRLLHSATIKNKTSARSPALASAQIAPKICQGQLQKIYSEFHKFHPNPFTSGGVIAKHVNIVETRHKVFPILGEVSSPSNNVTSHWSIFSLSFPTVLSSVAIVLALVILCPVLLYSLC